MTYEELEKLPTINKHWLMFIRNRDIISDLLIGMYVAIEKY